MNPIQFAIISLALFVILALTNDNMDDDDEGPGGGILQPVYNRS